MHKYQKIACEVNKKGRITIPSVHRKAICKAIGVEDLTGSILELNITVIHLIDNREINLSLL
jgi:hypothetical protein